MKERVPKCALRILTATSLVFTAACTGIDKIFTPTQASPTGETSPTPNFEPTPTFEPTRTFTPEPTFTPSIEPTPASPENPGFFEGVGQIASVEEYEGEWYGIDTLGRAEIVQNDNGEWIKYERPLEFAAQPELENAILPELLKDLNQEDVTRLNDGANSLPWGIIQEEHPFPGYSFAHVFVSGYPLGAFKFKYAGGSDSMLVFEIPLRYQRQVFVMWLPDQPSIFLDVYKIPTSGNIHEIKQKVLSFHDYMLMMSNPSLRGNQIVLAFQMNEMDSPNPPKKGGDVFDNYMNTLYNSLAKGEATSIPTGFPASRVWVGESFFNK